jgi:hypothetical protein
MTDKPSVQELKEEPKKFYVTLLDSKGLREVLVKEGSPSIEEYIARALTWYEMTVVAQSQGCEFMVHSPNGEIENVPLMKELFKKKG